MVAIIPVAKISLGESGDLEFHSWSDLGDWIAKEEAAWSWMLRVVNYNIDAKAEFQDLLSNTRAYLQSLEQSTKQDPPNEGEVEQQKNRIFNSVQALSERIKSGRYILSDSPLGSYIISESKTDEKLASEMVYVAVQNISNDSNLPIRKRTFRAANLLVAHERGWDKRSAALSRKMLKALSEQYSVELSDLGNGARERLEALDESIAAREQAVENSTKNLASILAKHKTNTRQEQLDIRTETKTETDKLLSDTRAEMAEFKDFYEAQISLQGPVEYWNRKSGNHKKATGWTAGVFLLYCAICVGLLYSHFASYDGGFSGFLTFWKGASIASFGAFASVIALGLAFARVLYRMFASQLHLWNDCSERVTMIETYLALAQKGHAKEEFLGALLTRLFSPSSDGVVKDDLGPVGPVDAIGKHFANR